MAKCCQFIWKFLCCCCMAKKKGPETDYQKRRKQSTSERETKSVKMPRRIQGGIGRNESDITDEELLKPIKLPNDDINKQIQYMKDNSYEVLLDQFIASGTYGKVFKAYHLTNEDKNLIACKIIEVKDRKKQNKTINSMRKELYFLERLDFHYIIKTLKHFVFESSTETSYKHMTAYIYMEFASEGDMEEEVLKNGPFDNGSARRYFGQIACGIKCLHNHSIAHRDLKLENILLVKSKEFPGLKECKISDFGLSNIVYKEGVGFVKADQYCGTRPYMAPEVLRLRLFKNRKQPIPSTHYYDPMPVDCWALGVIAYRLLTKEFPFILPNRSVPSHELNPILEKVLDRQNRNKWSYPTNIEIETFANTLISKCLEPNVSERIDMTGIISHPWLEGETSLTEPVVIR